MTGHFHFGEHASALQGPRSKIMQKRVKSSLDSGTQLELNM